MLPINVLVFQLMSSLRHQTTSLRANFSFIYSCYIYRSSPPTCFNCSSAADSIDYFITRLCTQYVRIYIQVTYTVNTDLYCYLRSSVSHKLSWSKNRTNKYLKFIQLSGVQCILLWMWTVPSGVSCVSHGQKRSRRICGLYSMMHIKIELIIWSNSRIVYAIGRMIVSIHRNM
jgi:hypothetical protein